MPPIIEINPKWITILRFIAYPPKINKYHENLFNLFLIKRLLINVVSDMATNGRAYKTFCWSLAEAKCGEARRSNATELIGFVEHRSKAVLFSGAILFLKY